MMGLIKARVELSSSGWRVVWAQSVNEMVYNRRKRRRFKKSIRAMSQEQLLDLLVLRADFAARRVATTQENIFGSLIRSGATQ